MVREPAVAGAFYPAEPDILKKEIEKLLERAKLEHKYQKIKGIIVPHAGYVFSGQTAAYAFNAIKDEKFDTIYILAPAHRYPVRGVALYSGEAFLTPLGKVEIDEEAGKEMLSSLIEINNGAHSEEHSIEVELPFLQMIFEKFRIVPMLCGMMSYADCEEVSSYLFKSASKRKSLIVASSDFYHGYNYQECRGTQEKANKLIASFDIKGFADYYYKSEEKGVCIACGGIPIIITLLTTQKLGAKKVNLLHATNSGDVTGEKFGYVVAYSSFVITE